MTTAVPPVVTDPAVLRPELSALREAAERGDADTVLDALDDLRGRDLDEHAEVSAVLARYDGLDEPLERLVEDEPEDREARTLWAHRRITAASAPTEGEDHRESIVEVEQWLLRLCAEDPSDPQPWTLRLATSRLLGLGAVETRRRYGRLLRARPEHLAAQRWMLEGLGPQHGGSWEEALTFARAVAGSARPGSTAGTLAVSAHLSRWAGESGGGNPYYLARPEVVGEAESASDRWLAAAGPESLATIRPHTELAVALGLAGSRTRAKEHFRALGALVDPATWALAEQHHERLLALRAEALTPDEPEAGDDAGTEEDQLP